MIRVEIIEIIIKRMDYSYQMWRKIPRSALKSRVLERENEREKSLLFLVKREKMREMRREEAFLAFDQLWGWKKVGKVQ